jgi:hypothetical protein
VNHVRRSRLLHSWNKRTQGWLEWLLEEPWVDDYAHYEMLHSVTANWPSHRLNPIDRFDPLMRPYLEEQPQSRDLYAIMRHTFHGVGLVDHYLFTSDITEYGDELLGLPPGTMASVGIRNRHEDRLAKIKADKAKGISG